MICAICWTWLLHHLGLSTHECEPTLLIFRDGGLLVIQFLPIIINQVRVAKNMQWTSPDREIGESLQGSVLHGGQDLVYDFLAVSVWVLSLTLDWCR